jgi:hypothetical protein
MLLPRPALVKGEQLSTAPQGTKGLHSSDYRLTVPFELTVISA